MLSASAFAKEKALVRTARAAGLLTADEAAELVMHLLRRVDLGGGAKEGGAAGGAAGGAPEGL